MSDNQGRCLFCGKPVRVVEIDGGGQVSFCPDCFKKLEEAKVLEIKHDVVILKKPLIEVILSYPTAQFDHA
ncbi:MAG: hypothetical protein ACXQTA_04205 [Candidatus Syntropharchaeales archaeon]